MITMEQLATLASELYVDSDGNHPTVGAYQDVTSLTLDREKAAPFLAQSPYGSDSSDPRFFVWSSREGNSTNAYNRGFYSTFTDCYYYGDRYAAGLLAVCLGD